MRYLGLDLGSITLGISISDLTPAVAEFINNAAVGSAQQRGLQTLEDQDLSTSYSEIDKYY